MQSLAKKKTMSSPFCAFLKNTIFTTPHLPSGHPLPQGARGKEGNRPSGEDLPQGAREKERNRPSGEDLPQGARGKERGHPSDAPPQGARVRKRNPAFRPCGEDFLCLLKTMQKDLSKGPRPCLGLLSLVFFPFSHILLTYTRRYKI